MFDLQYPAIGRKEQLFLPPNVHSQNDHRFQIICELSKSICLYMRMSLPLYALCNKHSTAWIKHASCLALIGLQV